MEGRYLLRVSERRENNFFVYGNFYKKFERYVKRPCERVALSVGAPAGESGGGSFAGNFERKKNAYLGSFFLDPEEVKSLSLGAIWNFNKGTGLA